MDEPKKPMSKTDILISLAESTGLTKQKVAELLDELAVRQLRLRKELSKLLEPLVLKRVHKAFSVPSLLKTTATTA